MDPLVIAAILGAALALVFSVLAVAALRRRRRLAPLVGVLVAMLLLSLSGLLGTLSLATRGYRALTHEEVAATAEIRPAGRQRFSATLVFQDGARKTFLLTGDQLYVDAHILKWKPVANLFGLHTTYELDRVGGRYLDIEDERDRSRALFSLKRKKAVDMFTLRRRHEWLGPLLDAEYGSATFVEVDEPAAFEVRVSTSGLLIRRL